MKKQRHATQPPKRNNRKKAARPATPKVRRRAHKRPTQSPKKKSSGNGQWLSIVKVIAHLIIAVLSFTAHYTKPDTPAAAPVANWHIVSTSASTYHKTPPPGGVLKTADTALGGASETQIADKRDGTEVHL